MTTLARHLGFAVGAVPFGAAKTRALQRAAGVTLATVGSVEGLNALWPEWSALHDAYGLPAQVFQAVEWLAIWAGIYCRRGLEPAVVTARIDGRLVLVWPLVVRHAFGLRILTGMGYPFSQYTDAVIAPEIDERALDSVLAYILALPVDVVALRKVRDDAALAPLLRRRFAAPENRQVAPCIAFDGLDGAAAFEQRFSGKLRSNRRRRWRRLEERGAVTFETYETSRESAALVRTALAFKRDWAHQSGIPALAVRDPRFEALFVAAARGGTAARLRISVLRCADEIVGIALSVVGKRQVFGHVLAPRPGLDSLGIGGLLAERTITSALDDGFAGFDLLSPADPYKIEWTPLSVGVGDYYAPRTLLGHAYVRLWVRHGRATLKRCLSRFFQWRKRAQAQSFN